MNLVLLIPEAPCSMSWILAGILALSCLYGLPIALGNSGFCGYRHITENTAAGTAPAFNRIPLHRRVRRTHAITKFRAQRYN